MTTEQKIEVHTRVVEVGVNSVLNFMGNVMALNGVEALLVIGHTLKHLEQKTGLKYETMVSGFTPDLSVVRPDKV